MQLRFFQDDYLTYKQQTLQHLEYLALEHVDTCSDEARIDCGNFWMEWISGYYRFIAKDTGTVLYSHPIISFIRYCHDCQRIDFEFWRFSEHAPLLDISKPYVIPWLREGELRYDERESLETDFSTEVQSSVITTPVITSVVILGARTKAPINSR